MAKNRLMKSAQRREKISRAYYDGSQHSASLKTILLSGAILARIQVDAGGRAY